MKDLDSRLGAADPLHGGGKVSADATRTLAKELAMTSTMQAEAAHRPDLAPRRLASQPAARSRRRRRLLAAALAGGLVAVPTAAVAISALPGTPADVFAYWRTDSAVRVDPASATRAGTAPGPEGSTLTVLRARTDDRTCLAAIFETARSAASNAPVAFQENGSTCWSGTVKPEPFGVAGAAVTGTDGAGEVRAFHVLAGDAARAELRLADGTIRPALLVEGYFFGWFTSDEPADPVLFGYGADGSGLGEVVIQALR